MEIYRVEGLTTLADLDRLVEAGECPVLLVEGTRALPEGDVPLVQRMGRLLVGRYPTATFRSGNAEGTDTVFANAIGAVDPARMEYVLPTPTMGKGRRHPDSPHRSLVDLPAVAEERLLEYTVEASPDSKNLAKALRGDVQNGRLAAKARYLLRDTLKVLGCPEIGLPPATAGIFYVKESDPLGGGTGHTIRVCLRHNVPVCLQKDWREWGLAL